MGYFGHYLHNRVSTLHWAWFFYVLGRKPWDPRKLYKPPGNQSLFQHGVVLCHKSRYHMGNKSHSHPFPYNGSNILNQSTVNQISINKNHHYPIFCSDVSTKSCILDATCGAMVGSLALALELFSQNHADLALLPLVQGESWPGLNGHGHHFIMPNSWGNDWNDDVLFVWIYFSGPISPVYLQSNMLCSMGQGNADIWNKGQKNLLRQWEEWALWSAACSKTHVFDSSPCVP